MTRPVNATLTRGESADPLVRLSLGVTVVGAIVLLYFTLFPFDFVDQGRSPTEIVRRFSLTTGSPWAPRDVPANILLTIPLGLGVGGLVRLRKASTWTTVVVASLCTLVLSCGVELAQSAWLLREPSLDDIVANAAGGAVGAWLWTRAEPWLRSVGGGSTSAAPRVAWRVGCLVLALLPAVLVSAVTIAHRTASEPAGWDPRFPLVVGNEPTGNRPWRGSVARFALADRALTDDEIAGLLGGGRMSEIAPRSTLVDHDFREDPAVPTGWRVRTADGPSAAGFSPDGFEVGPDRWMQTDGPVRDISRRIDATNSFTVLVDATAASARQLGPARLLSISGDGQRRNLTIAQDGSDLVVRVRSAFTGGNGISPEFVLPDVFRGDSRRSLIVTYRPSSVSVTVDQAADTSHIALLPETVPLVATFTDELRQLRFSAVGNALRPLVVATIMFAPWVVWLSLAALAHRRRAALAFALVLVVVPVVVIEALFAWTLPGHPFRVGFVLATAAAGIVVVWGVMHRPRAASTGGSERPRGSGGREAGTGAVPR